MFWERWEIKGSPLLREQEKPPVITWRVLTDLGGGRVILEILADGERLVALRMPLKHAQALIDDLQRSAVLLHEPAAGPPA